jgi:hypothetical protein
MRNYNIEDENGYVCTWYGAQEGAVQLAFELAHRTGKRYRVLPVDWESPQGLDNGQEGA